MEEEGEGVEAEVTACGGGRERGWGGWSHAQGPSVPEEEAEELTVPGTTFKMFNYLKYTEGPPPSKRTTEPSTCKPSSITKK